MAARGGKTGAIITIGREILFVVYHMVKDGTAYQELGGNDMDERRKTSRVKYHKQ